MDQGLTLTMCISFSIYRGTLPSLWNLLSNRWFQDEETNLSLCQSYLHQEWCNEVILLRYSYSYIAPTGDQQHPSHFSLYQIKCIYEEAFDVEPVISHCCPTGCLWVWHPCQFWHPMQACASAQWPSAIEYDPNTISYRYKRFRRYLLFFLMLALSLSRSL